MAKNRIVYGLIFIMTVTFVFLAENQAAYAALYAVLLIPLMSFTVLLICRRRIYISDKLDKSTVKKGESVRYSVNVNHNIFNFRTNRTKVIFEKDLRETSQIIKYGGENSDNSDNFEDFEIICKYRGTYNISAEYIFIYDLLGLFKIKIKNPNRLNLTVLPNIISSEDFGNLQTSFNHVADSLKADGVTDDNSDLSDFKKYSPEDGYKRIHWQLSAKRGELISKNYNTPKKATAAVIIDNSKITDNIKRIDAMQCEDSLIEAAVSAIAYCNAMDMSIYLDFPGRTAVTHSLDFDALYTLAAGIQFDGQEDFTGFVTNIIDERKNTNNTDNTNNIYIFTQKVKKPLIDCAERLRSSGCNALIFYYDVTERKCKLWL